jgi:hypothetical protein
VGKGLACRADIASLRIEKNIALGTPSGLGFHKNLHSLDQGSI